MKNLDVNPHNFLLRMGMYPLWNRETLVKYSDDMELQPWLAKEWENTDPLTWKITLQDNVTLLSSGRSDGCRGSETMSGASCWQTMTVRQPIRKLIRWKQTVRCLRSTHPSQSRTFELPGDPYGCIIDVDADLTMNRSRNKSIYCNGTASPVIILTLVKNENYWNGTHILMN